MLHKLTRRDAVEVLPLSADAALLSAQHAAASVLADDDERIAVAVEMFAASGSADPRASANALIAEGAHARYVFTSDVSELLAVPGDCAFAHIRAPSQSELRAAELRAGPYPRLGQRASARAHAAASDLAADDYAAAYDAAVDGLNDDDRAAIHAFDLWRAERDAQVAACALLKVANSPALDAEDAFGLARTGGGYPVEDLVSLCGVGPAVIAEVAMHIGNLARLGKAGGRSLPSEHGAPKSPSGQPGEPGPVGSAGEIAD